MQAILRRELFFSFAFSFDSRLCLQTNFFGEVATVDYFSRSNVSMCSRGGLMGLQEVRTVRLIFLALLASGHCSE